MRCVETLVENIQSKSNFYDSIDVGGYMKVRFIHDG